MHRLLSWGRPAFLLACVLAAALTACQDSLSEPYQPLARPTALRASAGPLQPACGVQYPAQPTSSRYGVVGNWGRRTVNLPIDTITNATYGQIATLHRQANVGWVRVQFDWGEVLALNAGGPDTNALDFSSTDTAVANAWCRGVNILGTIAYTPRWAVNRPVAAPNEKRKYLPDSLRHWEAAVRRIVNRYPQIRYWSIWNEPNATSYFRGQNDGTEADRIRDYNTLLGRAAPHIRGNVDAQGRRYLVALELGATPTQATAAPWLRGVLNAHGGNIDVVAYHHYGGVSGIRDQVSGIAAYNGSAVGGWRWPIWLTEAGPTGCLDTPFLSRSPTTCARDSLAYANESHLAGHVQGVLTAMNQSSAAAQWAKTFTWHSHNETVFNTAERKYEGDERGLLLGAFSNRVMGRPAFTAYAGVAGPLRLSGADYGYNQQVPVTANPAVPGSYYYVWEYRWCYNGNATGDCDYRWYHYREGQDVSTISPYLNRQDFWEEVRVRQYAWQGGPQLGAAEKTIYGAGECTDPRGCPIRPLGGGGAGADSAAMAAADTVAALRAPAKRPPGVSDVTWERMKGHKGRGNG